MHRANTLEQLKLVGPSSLGVSLLTASFVGMVFTIQVQPCPEQHVQLRPWCRYGPHVHAAQIASDVLTPLRAPAWEVLLHMAPR